MGFNVRNVTNYKMATINNKREKASWHNIAVCEQMATINNKREKGIYLDIILQYVSRWPL